MTENNPFSPISAFHIDPGFTSRVEEISMLYPDVPHQYIERIKKQPCGQWITSVNDIEYDESDHVYVIYNLPNRDCNSVASNGDLCCNDKCKGTCTIACQQGFTDCSQATRVYQEFIDEVSYRFHPIAKKIIILEPDAIPNCASNLGINGCTISTCSMYKENIRYAINRMSLVENTFIYLDIGHGNWMGWENNLRNLVNWIKDLDLSKIRGFSINVSNYQNMGIPCEYRNVSAYNDFLAYCRHQQDPCCRDPCNRIARHNACNNENNFIQIVSWVMRSGYRFASADGTPRFVVDTSRNGGDSTTACDEWCNNRLATLGSFPSVETTMPMIDAFFWIKNPGFSDGCLINNRCKECSRYDKDCDRSPVNMGYYYYEQCPPESGQWFTQQFYNLVKNNNFL
jgi:cellulose 1,4-beta-cellobiosidase